MYVRPSLTRFKKSRKGYLTTLICTIMLLILATSDIHPSIIKVPDWTIQDLAKVIAAKNNLNPYLVMSIIKVESSWRPKTVSSKGALGLMQVMPAWIPHLAHLGIRSKKDLLDPEKNILAGCYVLKVHLREESHSLPKALNAYSGRSKGYAEKVLINLAELEKRAQGKSEEHRIM